MKKTLLIIIAVVVMIGVITAGVMAIGGRITICGPMGNGFGYHNDYLNLTNDQQQKILVFCQEFQKETIDLRFSLREKNLEIRQLWAVKPLNQNAIDNKTKEVTALKVQINAKVQTLQDKIRSILTPEQIKQLNGFSFNCGTEKGYQEHCGGCVNGCF